MNILALDISSVVGCCSGTVGGEPVLWSWDMHKEPSRPKRFAILAAMLGRYLHEREHDCDGVVYEAPMPLSAMLTHGAREETVAFLRGSIGVVELLCAQYDTPVKALNVQKARASVLGWYRNPSKGKKTKDRVIEGVRALGVEPDNEHEADAYVLWAYACARLNPRLAIALTPLFREGEPKI